MPPRSSAPTLEGFTLIDWLGGGGFADVFRYHDHSLEREVAIKVLHRGVSTSALAAFRNEASLMAKLSSHPNIVSVFQVGTAPDGRPYLVMEMCPAPHLGDRVGRRGYGPAKAMEVGIQIAGAVETAHRLGILHRDIKPANILFTAFGRPALADFGISVSLDEGTAAGTALSPLWAPMEQFGGASKGLGPWSDVYSLAATMWASLVGHSPMYVAGEPNDILHLSARIRTMPVPRTGRADVPEELERVLAVGMAKDPRERFQSALEFARALQGVQGAINQAVTPIDVYAEQQVIEDEPDLEGEGTRISGFRLIDPDQADSTSHLTGPTSGRTTPIDRSEPAEIDGVMQHGRGRAVPGLRDFTAREIPSIRSYEMAQQPGQPDQEEPEEPRRKAPVGFIASAVAVVLLLGGGTAFFLINGSKSATTPNQSVSQSPTVVAVDPLTATVPEVKNLVGKVDGAKVKFTWTNPKPEEGDQYTYTVIDPRGGTVREHTKATEVTVTALEGDTCIEVKLVRANGRGSSGVTGCAP